MIENISDDDYKRYSEVYYKIPRFASWPLTDFIRFCVEWENVTKEIRRLAKEKGGRKNEKKLEYDVSVL